jgi:hypothetical protein
VVQSVIYLGPNMQYAVECPGAGTLVVGELSDPAREPVAVGDDVVLTWALDASIVLGGDTRPMSRA